MTIKDSAAPVLGQTDRQMLISPAMDTSIGKMLGIVLAYPV
ncbi:MULTISPECIES: hypothetical protein [unclassified Mesorhizobium]|nr:MULTISPECIES: hypothetical protein [unclassified Mesorhizobium]